MDKIAGKEWALGASLGLVLGAAFQHYALGFIFGMAVGAILWTVRLKRGS